MTDEELNRRFDQMDERMQRFEERMQRFEERMQERLEAFAQALIGNLSDLRTELTTRLDRIERRTERTENSVNAILAQTAGMSKSLTEGERIDTAHATILAQQQRAIDELYRKIAELERRNPPAA